MENKEFDQKAYDAAGYFLDIFASFIDDDEVNKMLEIANKNISE